MANQAPNPLLKLFTRDLSTNKNLTKDFQAIFEKHNGNWDEIKPKLKSNKAFGDELVDKLEFTQNLAVLSNNNGAFIEHFQDNNATNSLAEIGLTQSKLDIAKIMGKELEDPEVNKTWSSLYVKVPNTTLAYQINNPEIPLFNNEVGRNIAQILTKQTSFNILKDSVYEVFQDPYVFKDIAPELQGNVMAEMKTLQRVARISPVPEVIPVLINANFTTSLRVSETPSSQFIANMVKNGLTEAQAHTVHEAATMRIETFQHTLMGAKEVLNGTGVAFIDKSLNAQRATSKKMMKRGGANNLPENGETLDVVSEAGFISADESKQLSVKNTLNWDMLFADADLCECGECTSVYSAASYFVELLQYLRNNNLSEKEGAEEIIKRKTDPKDIKGTVLEALFNRRPDLGCLELTCKNTNTILPYVDLVNEVLEQFVVFDDAKKLKAFNVADEASSELLAQAQHTNYDAYCILSKSVYPFNLPYHQPIDTTRIFLEFLETSRYEVMDTFPSPRKSAGTVELDPTDGGEGTLNPTAEREKTLNEFHKKYLQRATDAEFLGITQDEYVILTQEAFVSHEHWDKQCDKIHNKEEYEIAIHLKPTYEYFGYANESEMIHKEGEEIRETDLTFVKKNFLPRTGIQYADLVELLKTQYLNPNLPIGKSLAIMESLRSSYRAMQIWAAFNGGIEKLADQQAIWEQWADAVTDFQDVAKICSNPSTPAPPKFGSNEIKKWIKCHFEKVGQMIVLENGRECIIGVINNSDIPWIFKGDGKIYSPWKEDEVIGEINCNTGELKIFNEKERRTYLDHLSNSKEYGVFNNNKLVGVFINNFLINVDFTDTCNIDTVELKHLNGSSLSVEEYDRFHRFIRLQKKMRWTIDETDKAIMALSKNETNNDCGEGMPDNDACESPIGEVDCGCQNMESDCGCDDCNKLKQAIGDINPVLIHQLVAVKKLVEITGLELIKLLAFWTDISTVGEKSLYARLLLTHNLLGMDKVFKADANGNFLGGTEKINKHIPVLMAAFNLTADDINDIIKDAKITDELTIANISVLYRYRLLSKVLALRVSDFISAYPIFAEKPFHDAYTTLQFMENWAKMEEAGFDFKHLNYIINNKDDERKPLDPNQKTILQLAKTLYDGLNGIDVAHPDLKAVDDESVKTILDKKISIQNQASSEFVRSKTALLYDSETTDAIMALLEGTTVSRFFMPKDLNITINPSVEATKKLKYDKKKGGIIVTGIVSDTEKQAILDLNRSTEWYDGIEKAILKSTKIFDDVLLPIFKDEIQRGIIKSDLLIPDITNEPKPLKNPDGTEKLDENGDKIFEDDLRTAPAKRASFINVFLPYLRKELSYRYIISTIGGVSGLDNKTTELLITKTLKNQEGNTLFSVFEKVKTTTESSTSWSGVLIPSTSGDYTFVVETETSGFNTNSFSIKFDDESPLEFEEKTDIKKEFWSKSPKTFKAGQVYKFVVFGLQDELTGLSWKTGNTQLSKIPSSMLLPDHASLGTETAFITFQKASMLINTFKLNADEIDYLDTHSTDFGNLDFNIFLTVHWLRLEAYTRFRNSLPETKTNLLEFLQWCVAIKEEDNAEKAKLSQKIADLTFWKKEQIDKLIEETHFNINGVVHFRDERNLLRLQKAIAVANKVRVDINMLFDWAKPSTNFGVCRTVSENIRNVVRSKYNQTDWEQVVKPLNDKLRNNQKDALISYLMVDENIPAKYRTDANGLFEFFLIDVQMDACMETSRIKQAISSVQLFVQRCFLGLEEFEDKTPISAKTLDRKRWEWMQRYRVWEANRKVFLYPENWIESNLRDDKSPFFKELESELLQKDITKQNVTDALKNYLYKVDEVANMEVVGLYIDGNKEENKPWTKNAKLHVFSRTRNAPYFFYYRYLELDTMNWYPWEKMQVDIPSYDATDANGNLTRNGCYLTPVVWNGRLLVFFPQILKKTKPSENKEIQTLPVDSNDPKKGTKTNIPTPPIELYEVKMAWSEYRNGKWTQKQISTAAILSNQIDLHHDLQYFKFIPQVTPESVYILFDDFLDADNGFFPPFVFDGNILKLDLNLKNPKEYIKIDRFNQQLDSNNNLVLPTWQLKPDGFLENKDIHFSETGSKENITGLDSYSNFHHPYTHDLLGKINLGELENLFKYNLTIGSDKNGNITNHAEVKDAFGGGFDNDNNPLSKDIYHELKCPYSLYNWELFFHTPILLADALSKSQQFEEAMKWFHYVFNPMADGEDDTRFWGFAPFKDLDAKSVLDKLFNQLQPNTKAGEDITEWRNKPFMPHVVARNRPVAYMKWVVMKYVDNLVAWGDYLFRQDTIESINQATQLYVLGYHILGQRPQFIPKRGKIKPQSYISLLNKWDAYGNAMTELELYAPFSNQILTPSITKADGETAFANVFGMASSLYFCIPNNPKLTGYWDTIEDRLYKIRHCENIEGVFRKLPLFEPPIDPALLVRAAANGLSIGSVLNDLNTPMPNYRFYYLLQKALELCNELKSLGGAMLSAIEKKDNESISLIRAKHEGTMQNLLMEIKKKQLEEAQKAIENLFENIKLPQLRMKHFLKLAGEDVNKVPSMDMEFIELGNKIDNPLEFSGYKLIQSEIDEVANANEAHDWQYWSGAVEALAGIVYNIPVATVDAKPIGVGAGVAWGGLNLGNVTQSAVKLMQTHSSTFSHKSSNAQRMTGFQRAYQERILQANVEGRQIKQIHKQITAQEIRLSIANQEIINQQKQIDNSQEIEEFLKNKYTNDELYTWMKGNLKTLYHQVYSLAYELAKKAEKVYRFERGLTSTNFIQGNYWDAGREGLLAGEQLYVGLKQLEAAYHENRGYDYEITKHVSVRQIDPMALLLLRETGTCEFSLPEFLFDMDYPGHYKRRIKSVSISVPCIAGPYTGLNATLNLLENEFRNSAIPNGYQEKTGEEDARFNSFIIPIASIAASSGQNDSGMFELNFKDERYLPFEGAGVISKWRLELPNFRQFDYDTISDVVVHIRYTSCKGGEQLRKAATNEVKRFMSETEDLAEHEGMFVIIDLIHDLPTEWHKALVANESGKHFLDLSKAQNYIPFFAVNIEKKLNVLEVSIISTTEDLTIQWDEGDTGTNTKTGILHVNKTKPENPNIKSWGNVEILGITKDVQKAFMIIQFQLMKQ